MYRRQFTVSLCLHFDKGRVLFGTYCHHFSSEFLKITNAIRIVFEPCKLTMQNFHALKN